MGRLWGICGVSIYTWIFFDKYNEIFKNIFDSLKKCAKELHGLKILKKIKKKVHDEYIKHM